jgi:predicted NBD/HSP70 family sugar kinase
MEGLKIVETGQDVETTNGNSEKENAIQSAVDSWRARHARHARLVRVACPMRGFARSGPVYVYTHSPVVQGRIHRSLCDRGLREIDKGHFVVSMMI